MHMRMRRGMVLVRQFSEKLKTIGWCFVEVAYLVKVLQNVYGNERLSRTGGASRSLNENEHVVGRREKPSECEGDGHVEA